MVMWSLMSFPKLIMPRNVIPLRQHVLRIHRDMKQQADEEELAASAFENCLTMSASGFNYQDHRFPYLKHKKKALA